MITQCILRPVFIAGLALALLLLGPAAFSKHWVVAEHDGILIAEQGFFDMECLNNTFDQPDTVEALRGGLEQAVDACKEQYKNKALLVCAIALALALLACVAGIVYQVVSFFLDFLPFVHLITNALIGMAVLCMILPIGCTMLVKARLSEFYGDIVTYGYSYVLAIFGCVELVALSIAGNVIKVLVPI